MNELVQTRTPQLIATEIGSIKGQTRDFVLHSSVEIGRRLIEAKELVPHGQWGEWLKENVDYSQSTANNLMSLYREYGDKSQSLGNLSYTKALALLGVPDAEREQFVAENDVDNLSAKELQQVIKDKQKLEERLKKAEFQAEHERVSAQNLSRDLSRLQAEIEEAKLSGNDDEARDLQAELDASKNRIAELENELKQKPIDVGAVVERVPEEVEAELAELRKKVAQPNSQSAVKFRFCFEAVAKRFQELLVTLDEVKYESPEAHEKYKGAVTGLIGKMSERL